jgi:putative aldouronate transport system substrate-binding protein
MKNKFSKVLLVLSVVSLVMMPLLAACGSSGTNGQTPASTTSDVVKTSEEPASTQEAKEELAPATLRWVTRCNPQTDYGSVSAEMNKILTEKINAELNLELIDVGSFDQKAKTMMAGGEVIDIIFTSNFANDYNSAAAKGAYLPLNDLLTQYAPESYAKVPAAFWEATKIDNKIYGFINYQIEARQGAITAQKAMLDKYGFDLTGVKRLEDLEPLLAKMKQGESSDKTIFEMSKDGLWTNLLSYTGLDQIGGANTPGVIGIGDDSLKVINQFETPAFKEHVNLMRRWYEAGYIIKDAATFTAVVDSRKTGNVLTQVPGTYKPGLEGEMKTSFAGDYVVQPFDAAPFVNTTAITSTLNAIPITSKNPERAMMLLEIVNTDKNFNNLLNFGIENKHYKKTGDDQIEFITDSGYAPNRAWTFGTQFLAFYAPGQATDTWEKTKQMNESAQVSKAMGFNFNAEAVSSEIAQCASVVAEYGPGLWTGFVDPDKYLPEFISKLKTAGADTIIAEEQSQLNAWKANKK